MSQINVYLSGRSLTGKICTNPTKNFLAAILSDCAVDQRDEQRGCSDVWYGIEKEMEATLVPTGVP
jgi:hypothetical protein